MLTSIEIAKDEIHLWDTSLAVGDEVLARMERLLSPDERVYADEFSHTGARRQYVISRGILRELLSRYVGTPPADIRFGIEGAGKPVLAGARDVDFNLSHSGELVLYGIAVSRPVGVDMEHVRPIPKAVELARRFMSPAEQENLAATPPDRKDREFLSMWVKRESYAKALGTSVWRALEQLHPMGNPVGSADANPQMSSGHAVRLVDYSDEYVAAVAAAGSDWRIVRRGTAT